MQRLFSLIVILSFGKSNIQQENVSKYIPGWIQHQKEMLSERLDK